MIHRLIRKEDRRNVLAALGKGGRTLAQVMPRPMKLTEMRRPLRRSLIVAIELLVGVLVFGAIFIGVVYQRLEHGTIDLGFLVPRIERAINDQFSDMSVKIESAFVGKNVSGRGVFFRLRNINLYSKDGEAIANAPLAAVGLSLEALLWGRIAPSQIVFIEPSLDVSYDDVAGLSLIYKSGARDGMDGQREEGGGAAVAIGSEAEQNAARLWRDQRVDFIKAVTAAFEEARKRQHSSSYLSQFGVRDAVVRFREGGREYSWRVPDFVIDMRHDDDSSAIRGFGRLQVGDVADQMPPWSLRFQTRQSDENKDLRIDFGIRDVTMHSLVRLVPALANLRMSDFPLGGKLTVTLGQRGDLRDSFANIQLSHNSDAVQRASTNSAELAGSELKLAYTHKGRRLHILPSPINLGDTRTTLSGVVEPQGVEGKSTNYKFALKLSDTRLAARELGLQAMIIDDAWATGSYSPKQDLITLEGLEVRAGSAVIRVNGSIERASTEPALLLNGQVSDVSLALLKRLWPDFAAPDTRKWIVENVVEGRVAAGRFAIDIPSEALRALPSGGDLAPEMVDIDMQFGDVVFKYLPELLPMNVPEAHLVIKGRKLQIDLPRGRVELPNGGRIRLSHGGFGIADLREDPPTAKVSFHVASDVAAAMQFLNQPSLKYAEQAGLGESGLTGEVIGTVDLLLPLKNRLKLDETSLKGKFRVVSLKSGKIIAGSPIEGGSIDISLSEKGIGVEGGVVVRAVPAKLNWQRIFGSGSGQQPPLRFSAVLSKAERSALGLTLAESYITGDIPLVVTVKTGNPERREVQVRADLTGASLDLGPAQWRKPAGAAAVLQFDVVPQKAGHVVLDSVSLVAKEFFLEGKLQVDAAGGKIQSFEFPNVSYKLINTMSVSGNRRDDGILAISASIKSLDGRTILRPLIIGSAGGKEATSNVVTSFDHDLVAQIETVIGDHGASLRNAHVEAKRRKGELEWLDFKGTISDRAPAAVRIEREEDGKRYLKAESHDAGSVFRLLGLYPSVEKGQLSLKIGLDSEGDAPKKGTLWVRNFSVIGSQLGELESGRMDPFRDGLTSSTTSAASSGKKTGKSRILFDQLKAPFSYGAGRFDLFDSYVNGPAVGATLRGVINFNEEALNLTGTFIPLYGLNSAVGEIPLLKDLLIGRKGEGIFGVTFAIEGPTSQPVMVVNPMSLLAPGVFRQIFDFANEQPQEAATGTKRRREKRRMQRSTVPVPQ